MASVNALAAAAAPSIPKIAPWGSVSTSFTQVVASIVDVDDVQKSFCWDANTLAVGAQVTLKLCNTITPTQVFKGLVQQDKSVVLTAANFDKTFCVELGQDRILSLQECRANYNRQAFVLDPAGVTLRGDNKTCIAPATNAIQSIGLGSCDTKSNITIANIPSGPASFPSPYQLTQFNFANTKICIGYDLKPHADEGSNFPYAIGTAIPAPCDGSPAQQWYWWLGQIRNVESGLCLDSPVQPSNWNDDKTKFAEVLLNKCEGQDNSQLWVKTEKNTLLSSISYNCVRLATINGTQSIRLGTDFCGAKDALRGPQSFQGLTAALADKLEEPACKKPRTRKDFRDLSPKEQKDFFRAYTHLHNVPSLMGRMNRYHDYVSLHASGGRWFHGVNYFLPWHRYFSALLEKDMQDYLKNATFAFPYWAWGSNSDNWNMPETGMLTPENFGTSSYNSPTYCVDDGFMNKTWVTYGGGCITRYIQTQEPESIMYSEAYMLSAISMSPKTNATYKSFDEFQDILADGPHNSFHSAIGGGDGSMSRTATSVNDPIFFMHHNNIDRYWQAFQIAHPKLKAFNGKVEFPPDNAGQHFEKEVSTSDWLAGFNVPVSAGLGIKVGALCHNYQPYSKSIAAVSVTNSKSPLARRSIHQRRASEDGKTPADVISTLDPAVAGTLIQTDIAIQADSADRSSVGVSIPLPSRKAPTRLPDKFVQNMAFGKAEAIDRIRKTEEAALRFMDTLNVAIDTKLQELFGVAHEHATFEQNAAATKLVIAEMAAASKSA
ncbi:hypothetical protein HDU97_008416 [Phlyctochytrium planicorne]|nr:hypothetical protein HDU97_008416 [Phlyctochytrium planicorne]